MPLMFKILLTVMLSSTVLISASLILEGVFELKDKKFVFSLVSIGAIAMLLSFVASVVGLVIYVVFCIWS